LGRLIDWHRHCPRSVILLDPEIITSVGLNAKLAAGIWCLTINRTSYSMGWCPDLKFLIEPAAGDAGTSNRRH
jgi:hypothetical protein